MSVPVPSHNTLSELCYPCYRSHCRVSQNFSATSPTLTLAILPQPRVAETVWWAQSEPMEQTLTEGYSTGVVDAHEHGDAAHDAGPLPLELVGLPEVAVDAGVQQANHSCKRRNTICASC